MGRDECQKCRANQLKRESPSGVGRSASPYDQGRSPRLTRPCTHTEPDTARNIRELPRFKHKNARSPSRLIRNQRCLICDHYGVLAVWLTLPREGGQETGDNLLPLCILHSKMNLHDMYASSKRFRQWLDEHDRYDVMIKIRNRWRALNE